jgi:hypothetical protein
MGYIAYFGKAKHPARSLDCMSGSEDQIYRFSVVLGFFKDHQAVTNFLQVFGRFVAKPADVFCLVNFHVSLGVF